MKGIKKLTFFGTLTAAVMALMPVSANAVSLAENGATGQTTVSYSPEVTYTVTIPAGVKLNGSSAVSAEIKAEDVSLESGQKIVVSLTAASNTDSGSTFHAKNSAGDSTATYTITAGSTAVSVGGTVAEFSVNGTQALSFSKASGETYAGAHTETLTFGLSVTEGNGGSTAPAVYAGYLWKIGTELDFGSGIYMKSTWDVDEKTVLVSGVSTLHFINAENGEHYYCYFDNFDGDYNAVDDGNMEHETYGFQIAGSGTETDPYYCVPYHSPID